MLTVLEQNVIFTFQGIVHYAGALIVSYDRARVMKSAKTKSTSNDKSDPQAGEGFKAEHFQSGV